MGRRVNRARGGSVDIGIVESMYVEIKNESMSIGGYPPDYRT